MAGKTPAMTGTADFRSALTGAEAFPTEGLARLAVLTPGYRASPDSRDIGRGSPGLMLAGHLWRLLTSERYRAHVRLYRDFYANPRPRDYMIDRAGELISARSIGQATLWCGLEDAEPRPSWAAAVQPVDFGDPEALGALLKSAPSRPDAILLLHSDAIGLGQEPVEAAILRAFDGPVVVLNGRRRIYTLNPSRRAQLRRRRFLADTRLVEAGWGLFLWVTGAASAVLDRVQSRRERVS